MLCLGFLIFLLAAVTFSVLQNCSLNPNANNFSSRKQLKHFSSIPLNQGKSYNKENYLSPPTLPCPPHTYKSPFLAESTYNNTHMNHRNFCVFCFLSLIVSQ